MATKPITPLEVVQVKRETLPDEVIKAFNDMITETWSDGSSCFKQDDVVKKMIGLLKASDEYSQFLTARIREMIFDKHWLDVEPIFREAGWIVKYDKPGYNESYSATFEFKRKDRKQE